MEYARHIRKNTRLDHLPGDYGFPVVGDVRHTLRVLNNPLANLRKNYERYGPLFKVRSLFGHGVNVIDPDGAQLVLQDKDKIFSGHLGWFPRLAVRRRRISFAR